MTNESAILGLLARLERERAAALARVAELERQLAERDSAK